MTAARRQLDLGFDEMEEIRHLAGAMERTVKDVLDRVRPLSSDASSKIVHQHSKRALRIAINSAHLSPSERATLKGAYVMVCRELGEAP